MNDDIFNMELRKFLKKVGVTSQREVERAVREAVANGRITGKEALPAQMRLTIETIGVDITIDGSISLV